MWSTGCDDHGVKCKEGITPSAITIKRCMPSGTITNDQVSALIEEKNLDSLYLIDRDLLRKLCNSTDSDGYPPLLKAASIKNNSKIINFISRLGSSFYIMQQDSATGTTALMHAVMADSIENVAAILYQINNNDPQLNAKDNTGKTALDYAIEINNADIIKALNLKLGLKGGRRRSKTQRRRSQKQKKRRQSRRN